VLLSIPLIEPTTDLYMDGEKGEQKVDRARRRHSR